MDAIFMNSGNSKTPKTNVLMPKLTNKLVLRMGKKVITLSDLSFYYTWNNIKSSYNNKLKISAPTWNDEFQLPGRSYSISDIQDYFEYILKKHEEDIAGKITSVSKKPSKELHNGAEAKEEYAEITTHSKIYISPKERQQIIHELRLVPKKDAYF